MPLRRWRFWHSPLSQGWLSVSGPETFGFRRRLVRRGGGERQVTSRRLPGRGGSRCARKSAGNIWGGFFRSKVSAGSRAWLRGREAFGHVWAGEPPSSGLMLSGLFRHRAAGACEVPAPRGALYQHHQWTWCGQRGALMALTGPGCLHLAVAVACRYESSGFKASDPLRLTKKHL